MKSSGTEIRRKKELELGCGNKDLCRLYFMQLEFLKNHIPQICTFLFQNVFALLYFSHLSASWLNIHFPGPQDVCLQKSVRPDLRHHCAHG